MQHYRVPRSARHSGGLLLVLALCYLLVLISLASSVPLRLGELLQAFAGLNFSWHSFMGWIALSHGGVPLHYLVQLPFELAGPHDRLLLRMPSLFSAALACYVFFRLAESIPIQAPLRATIVFALLPFHLQAATLARPFELALLCLVLATTQFHKVLMAPTVLKAGVYALLLTLCLYAQPASFFPAIGYLVFLLRFAGNKTQRYALWHVLAATLLAALLFLPYYAWASPQRRGSWLMEQSGLALGTRFAWATLLLFFLLGCGLVLGTRASLAPSPWPAAKRSLLFCLAGGSVVTAAINIGMNLFSNVPFDRDQMLGAIPGLVLLLFAGIEWTAKASATSATVVVAIFSILVDFEYFTTPLPEISDLVVAVRPQLKGDACVVFVSQREARFFFVLYDPELAARECTNFAHRRVVLASHPWVSPADQKVAESYFRGLNFKDVNRFRVAGGQVVTFEEVQ